MILLQQMYYTYVHKNQKSWHSLHKKQCYFKIFGDTNLPLFLSCIQSVSSKTSSFTLTQTTLTIIAENITVFPELKFEILREIEFVHFNVSTSRTITHIVNPLLSKLLLQQIFCMPEFHLTHLQTLWRKSLNCSSSYKIYWSKNIQKKFTDIFFVSISFWHKKLLFSWS